MLLGQLREIEIKFHLPLYGINNKPTGHCCGFFTGGNPNKKLRDRVSAIS